MSAGGHGDKRAGRVRIMYLLVAAALAAFVFFGFVLSSKVNNKLYTYQADDMRAKAELAAGLVGERITAIRALLEDLALGAAKGARITDGIELYTDLFGISRIGYVTADGRQTLVAADDTNGRVVNVSREEFFPLAMSGRFVVQGAKYDETASGAQNVYFAAPIKGAGFVTGAVTAIVDSKVFSDIIAEARFDARGVTFLCDGDDDILSADDEAIDSFASELRELTTNPEGRLNYVGPHGIRGIAVSAPTEIGEIYIASFVTGGVSAFDGISNIVPHAVIAGIAAAILIPALAAAFIIEKRKNAAVMVKLNDAVSTLAVKSQRDAGPARRAEESIPLGVKHLKRPETSPARPSRGADVAAGKMVVFEWSLLRNTFDKVTGDHGSIEKNSNDTKLEDFIADYARNFVFSDDKPAFLNMLDRERLIGAYCDGKTGDKMDYRRLTKDDYCWMRVETRLEPNEDASDIKLYIAVSDIDEEKRKSIIEYERANTDAATGALNIAAFGARASEIIASSGGSAKFALVIVQVNEYDAASDSYRRISDVRALSDIASRVKTVVSRDDIVGRAGADEFAVFITDVSTNAAFSQRLKYIGSALSQSSGGDAPPRVDIGAAVYPQNAADYDSLYQAARTALNRIKQRGLGGYALFNGETYDATRDDIPASKYRHSRRMLVATASQGVKKTVTDAFDDGYLVISAKDSDGVFIQLMRHAPSICCVLLDMDIPGMSGRDVMSYITKNEAYTGIPVIALSDKCDAQSELDAVSFGAADIIDKNMETGLFRLKVARTLTRVENDMKRARKSYSILQSAREERFRRVIDATDTLVFTHNLADDRYQYGPDAVKYLSGNFDSRPLDRILIDDCQASASEAAKMMQAAKRVERSSQGDDKAEYVLRLKTPEGSMHWFKTRFIRMENKEEMTRITLITLNDINDEVEAGDALKFRAERDMLTRLYNSETFYEKVREMIAGKAAGDYTLCSVDVDSFKVLNDRYGREEGDNLLKFIAELLRQAVEPVGGICCRVWGDRFCYVFPSGTVSTRFVLRSIEKKCREYTGLTTFTLSTGAYIIDDCSMPVALIYDRATIAKKSIKGNFLHHLAYYTGDMREGMLQEQAIVAQMENALKTGQFEVYLQPQFALKTSSLVGAEALVRWNHPEKGMISPSLFIPIFEKNGFISHLDRYVWDKTLCIIKSWIDEGKKLVPVSVNVSRSELMESDFISFITGLITSHEVPWKLFNVEITETAFAGAPDIIVNTVKRLKEYGVVVEIDDFGSGYSSLNTLKDVPADILKLDMRFVQKSGDAKRGEAIIDSVVQMAASLGMSVIAEGVETDEQADFLRSIGCRYAQGFLYAHPMTAADFDTLKESAKFEEAINNSEE